VRALTRTGQSVEYHRCKSFRLDPRGRSHLNLDGETLPYLDPIDVDVVQGAWCVFGPAIGAALAASVAPAGAPAAAAAAVVDAVQV
jgi:hypothetical protein